MSIVSKLAAGAAVALALSLTPALADGMPKKSYSGHDEGCSNRFGGAFIGGNIGAATLNNRFGDRDGLHTDDEGGGRDLTHVQNGLTIGGSAGYNVQKCAAVFGVVADLSWADLDSRRTFSSIANNTGAPDILNRSFDWYGSLRTRTGLAIDNLMLYTTGGIAFANSSLRLRTTTFNNAVIDTKLYDDIRFGWVAGVGTEYAINDKISITGETLYYDFGSHNSGIAGTNGQRFSFDDNQTMWVTRMGVSIKLGERAASYEPMK